MHCLDALVSHDAELRTRVKGFLEKEEQATLALQQLGAIPAELGKLVQDIEKQRRAREAAEAVAREEEAEQAAREEGGEESGPEGWSQGSR